MLAAATAIRPARLRFPAIVPPDFPSRMVHLLPMSAVHRIVERLRAAMFYTQNAHL
jgi:hypothetical protein